MSQLSSDDLNALSKLSPDQLSQLTPDNITSNVPGLSGSGIQALKGLSLPGFSKLPGVNVFSLANSIASSVSSMAQSDPLVKGASSVLGGIFGNDDPPPVVNATLFLVSSSGTQTKLKGTYIERGKDSVSIGSKIVPGTYQIQLVAKLKNSIISATSSPFTIVPKN